DENDVAGRFLEAAMERGALAAIPRLMEDAQPGDRAVRRKLIEDLGGAVLASVVDGDDLHLERLRHDTAQDRFDVVLFVVDGNDDGDERVVERLRHGRIISHQTANSSSDTRLRFRRCFTYRLRLSRLARSRS